jgi:(E)-2-((N-methylformamido)methylene)succinate hydrolase
VSQAKTASGTAYEVAGTDGPVIVLVHGLGLNRHSWQWQRPALAKDYRVITFDLYGHGESAVPPSPPSLSLFSAQILEILDDLGIDSAAVAGFSLGGMIARRFAMDHQDRLWALAVLHSAHARDKSAHDAIQARVHQAREQGPAATVEAALQRWFTDPFRSANPAVMDQVRKWIMANQKDVYAPIYQVLVDGVTELLAPKPPISVPALVMTADEDFGNSVEMSRAIAAEIPGSSLVILEGLRHMALAEAPERFNGKLIAFLHSVKAPD